MLWLGSMLAYSYLLSDNEMHPDVIKGWMAMNHSILLYLMIGLEQCIPSSERRVQCTVKLTLYLATLAGFVTILYLITVAYLHRHWNEPSHPDAAWNFAFSIVYMNFFCVWLVGVPLMLYYSLVTGQLLHS
jgi:predicted small integral membrane protein